MSRIDVLDHGFVTLVDSMPLTDAQMGDYHCDGPTFGAGDRRIVQAARVSYNGHTQIKTLEQDKRLLKYLYKNKHTSPFEKVRYEFHCKAPIFVARQWFRHRMGSFSEISARYAEMKDEFYVPELSRMQAQAKDNKQASGETLSQADAEFCKSVFGEIYEATYLVYNDLLKRGLSRELARMVLPVGLYTEFYWTVDAHNLMHFLRLRLHSHAQYEIRVFADALLKHAKTVAPFAFSLFEESV